MSWRKHWNKRPDGKYEYKDKVVNIPYIIDEEMFRYLDSLTNAERDGVLLRLMLQAAEAIERNPELTEYGSSLDTSPL